VKQIEIRRATTANRTNNRRTGNFNSVRPQLDENGKVIIEKPLGLNYTVLTVRGSDMEKQRKESEEDLKTFSKSTVLLAPAPAEIPRKAGFRVVMEHKLGLDWEHGENGEDNVDEMNQSLQTDQMLDGYDDAQTLNGKSILENSYRSRSGS